MTAARLTPHQAEVLGRLTRRAACVWDSDTGEVVAYKWIPEREIGSHSGLWHLVRKGYIEAREIRGPRGGTSYEYRPIDDDAAARLRVLQERNAS